jgi:hypothetical protein
MSLDGADHSSVGPGYGPSASSVTVAPAIARRTRTRVEQPARQIRRAEKARWSRIPSKRCGAPRLIARSRRNCAVAGARPRSGRSAHVVPLPQTRISPASARTTRALGRVAKVTDGSQQLCVPSRPARLGGGAGSAVGRWPGQAAAATCTCREESVQRRSAWAKPPARRTTVSKPPRMVRARTASRLPCRHFRGKSPRGSGLWVT